LEILRLGLIIPWIVAQSLDFNLSNFTRDGIIRVAFDPYYAIFGNFTWGVIFGFIGVALYANERSIGTITTYLILVGIFMSIIFPSILMGLFGLILTFTIATIFYRTFIESKM